MASAAPSTSAQQPVLTQPVVSEDKKSDAEEFGTCVRYYNWVVTQGASLIPSYDMMKIKTTDSIWMKILKFLGALPMLILCGAFDLGKLLVRTVTCGTCCGKADEEVKAKETLPKV